MDETDSEIVVRVRKQKKDSMLSGYFQKGLNGHAVQSDIDSLTVAVAAMVAAPDPE